MAEYASMTAVSGLAAILFFGGWNGPIPVARLLGLTYENHALLGYLGNLLGLANFLMKCGFGILVMMWLRWTLPRLRIDQVMTTCLKYCFPLAAAMFLGAMFWTYAVPGRTFFGLLPAVLVSEGSVAPEARNPKPVVRNPLVHSERAGRGGSSCDLPPLTLDPSFARGERRSAA